MDIKEIRNKLMSLGDKRLAENYKKYLKSEYNFYGLRVPMLRKIAKELVKNEKMNLYDAFNLFDELWNSGNHEEMSLGIFILQNFRKNTGIEMWNFLMKPFRIERAKSWDHIDGLGAWLLGPIVSDNPNLNNEVKNLSQSRNPWMRRLSIIMQAPSIKKGKIQLTILLAEKLVYDEDIYVQKGAGWMLRECAKKNLIQVQEFIKVHRKMKAAAFSYATEKMLPFRKHIKDLLEEDKLDKNNDKDKMKSELERIKYFKN